MFNPLRRWTSARYLRRISRDLDGIRQALDRQADLLLRLADHVAPADPRVDRQTLTAAETGVSHLDELDAALALAYAERTAQATGHTPDDDETAVYLADEKTTDLRQRLAARDAELERLTQERRW